MKTYLYGAMTVILTLIAPVGPVLAQGMGYPQQGAAGMAQIPPYAQANYNGAYGNPNTMPQGAPGDMVPGQPGEGEGGAAIMDGSPCFTSRWTVQVDALYLDRFGGSRQPLIQRISDGSTMVSSSAMDFNWAGSPRVDLVRHNDNGWDIEFAYFGIDGWSAAEAAGDPGGVMFNGAGHGAANFLPWPNNGMEFIYLSKFYSGEINLRHAVGKNLTLLLGFRALELQEDLLGRFIVANAADGTFIHTAVDNHLYGFQLGADGTLWAAQSCPFRIDGLAKAGVYANHAGQTTEAPNVGLASAANDHVSFLGEASLTAVWQITEHVAARGGYQAMWLQSVALAPNQLPVTDLGTGGAQIDMAGCLFYHGAFAGIQVDF